jgi:hypothetical protein
MSKLAGNNDFEKLASLAQRTYKEQAIWFLNSFWETLPKEAETLWKYAHKCGDLDLQNHHAGFELDELNAHRFLESFQETMTVREMRDSLRATGAIGDRVKMVPLIHYLIYKYQISWNELVNASQGSNKEEIEEAQRMLAAVQAAFQEAERAATAAAAALREAKAREADAKAKEAEAKAREAEAKAKEAAAKTAAEEAKLVKLLLTMPLNYRRRGKLSLTLLLRNQRSKRPNQRRRRRSCKRRWLNCTHRNKLSMTKKQTWKRRAKKEA